MRYAIRFVLLFFYSSYESNTVAASEILVPVPSVIHLLSFADLAFQAKRLDKTMTLFFVYINNAAMNYLEYRGNVSQEERLDAVCEAVHG